MLAGCGGGDDPPATATPTPAIATDERSVDAIEKQLQELARRRQAARRAGDAEAVEKIESETKAIERGCGSGPC